MILIDNRIGSKELMPLMPKNAAELTRLEFGDVAFLGRGVDDVPVSIGIERKRLSDMLTSMTTGRLSGHQLPGLANCYDVVYLVVEGLCRPNPKDGILEIPRRGKWYPVSLGARRFMAKELWSYLNTLQVLAGVHIWRTGTARETAQWIVNLYHWWNNKPMDAHKSHTLQHTPYAQLSTKRPSLLQRVAAQLPGVGFGKSKRIAGRFETVTDMVLASETDWISIEGIGKTLTKRIMEALQK